MDTDHDAQWAHVATRLWPAETTIRRVQPKSIKADIWDVLEAEGFPYSSLAALESLQILERYARRLEKL